MPANTIPALDLSDFLHGSSVERQAFIDALGKGYEEFGFIALRNHGLDESLRNRLYEVVRQYFDLPGATKKRYEIEGLAGQRGYTSFGTEHAKDSTTPDMKEFYHVGQEVTDGDPIANEYPANVWPEEVLEFKPVTLEAYRRLEDAGSHVLRAIALYLELPEEYFTPNIHNGNSILRPIHYPPIEDPSLVEAGAVRASAHEDINLITLLMGASADGLEIQTRDGRWIGVTALPEQIIVNVGDMLQRLTNNRLRSTTHRVVNPAPEKMTTSRYSIPFFLHPRSDMDLSCLASCIDEAHPKQYEDITAGEYLYQRLREIGLLA